MLCAPAVIALKIGENVGIEAAAQAADPIHLIFYHSANMLDEQVALFVSVEVVDYLEVIEVAYREHIGVWRAALNQLSRERDKCAAVVKAGELVALSPVAQLALGDNLIVHVVEGDSHFIGDAAFIGLLEDVHIKPMLAARGCF